MSETTPKPPSFEEALQGHQDLEAQMAEELGCEELSDPAHLSQEEQAMIARIARAKQDGVDVENDPITRGFVNGHIMRTIGESMEEPGYTETLLEADDYETFIKNGLDLTDAEKVKLIEMVSEENYAETVANARKMDPTVEIPSGLREKFIQELMTYSLEDFREILDHCEKPRIAIVTANSFEDKVANMNRNKHYKSQDGKQQRDAYVAEGAYEPYSNVATVDKVRVGIADLMPHPKQQKGASFKLGERRKYELARFGNTNKVRFAGPHVMATAYQQTLREAERTGDNSVILDNWEDGSGTATILNPENLTNSRLVACSEFNSYDRQVYFASRDPSGEFVDIRGRAWVQVLEF